MIRIWGRANSINVQKVLWACHEVGLEFERIDAGLQFGQVDTPAFRALNPNGLVPVLQDDDFVLWESHAIVRYLARRYSQGALWPFELRAAAQADQWMDWAATTVWPDMRVVFTQLVRRPPEERDVQAIEQARLGLCRSLAILEQHLGRQPWVGGGMFSMADIPLGVMAHRWFELPLQRPELPQLRRWYDHLRSRPGFARHCAMALT